jgi:hypothetical protein
LLQNKDLSAHADLVMMFATRLQARKDLWFSALVIYIFYIEGSLRFKKIG